MLFFILHPTFLEIAFKSSTETLAFFGIYATATPKLIESANAMAVNRIMSLLVS